LYSASNFSNSLELFLNSLELVSKRDFNVNKVVVFGYQLNN